ncbi:MAG: DUF255 domain-containing protein [Alphaproteobacteria bacterium]|nr:DUF255 domain-containing protein [Alphaproteobacteria bacterium]
MANMLAQSTSPYLLQHKDNPVHWRQWGPEALDEAQRLNKPIFLSVGYAACHWCHVMAHESFENPDVAAVMNDLYVCIKVDREERPDIDTIYQAALASMGEQGGWPLSMFLTPQGEPFWGGTYYPPEPRFERPGFLQVLHDVSRNFHENKTQVAENINLLRGRLTQLYEHLPAGRMLTMQALDIAAKRQCQLMDVFNGGMTGAPKFPNVPILELLWRAYNRTTLPQFSQAVDTALINMCQGGIYDHLGGGFARYSVDEYWLVPHFEKMLYDNAQLIDILSLVYPHQRNPIYRARVEETIAWASREMLVEGGAFASSLDADSDGEEGKFYVWTEAEIDEVLGKEGALFKQVYDVSARGNWEGRNILNRLRASLPLGAVEEGKLNAMREKLLARRNQRVRPGFDDKVLTDWNGLMITALANAAEVFNRSDWQAAAVKAFWFIAENLGQGDRLMHSWRAGAANHNGLAEDYANMARAALALYETTSHPPYLERAKAWVKILNDHFWRQDIGGYAMAADDGDQLIVRVRTVSDNAVPSANGTMLNVLARLFYLTGDTDHMARTNLLLSTFSETASSSPFTTATFLNAFDLILRGRQIVIVGARTDANVNAFREVLRKVSLPNRILNVVAPGEELHEGHPARGKTQVGNKATAYVCNAQTCSQPITDPLILETQLKTRAFDFPDANAAENA